ncbi:DUF3822 family protein [Ascidiimonas aurantiaca]|uniref:DUF3822 family protein n=1 Tax=Ascidiimonas aurantiaca TaxID=1685432 RepID=UPI0030EE307C
MTQKRIVKIPDLTNNELSIQVSLSGLSFCILDTLSKKIIHREHHSLEQKSGPEALLGLLKSTLDTYPLDVLKRLHVTHSNELSAFVPKPLFNKDHLSDYLKFNIKILENDVISFDEIENSEIINVYVPYMNVNNYLFDRFGPFEYKHSATLVTTHFLRERSESIPVMYAHMNTNHFEILVLKDRKLVFFNSFVYTTPEDFIYYLLFTAEQLDLNPDTFELRLFGAIDESGSTYAYAYKYIRNVSFYEPVEKYALDDSVKEEGTHSDFVMRQAFS